MASKAMCARALVLSAMVMASYSLTLDEEATSDVIAAAESIPDDGELVILVRGPHGKSARREELLHVKGADDIAISVYYNRKTNKVTLESLHGGNLKAVSWGLGTRPRGTLLLVIKSDRVKIIVGCRPMHWHSMSGTHNLLETLTSHKLKLYHEENAPVEVYENEQAAINSLDCDAHGDTIRPPTLLTVDETDVEEVEEFREKEARRKREEEMQGDEYRGNYIDSNGVLPQPTTSRGDIPSSGIESCDDEVIRQLQFLRQTIEQLRREILEQKGTIESLRGQLRQCCNRTPSPVERCSGSSCYPGY